MGTIDVKTEKPQSLLNKLTGWMKEYPLLDKVTDLIPQTRLIKAIAAAADAIESGDPKSALASLASGLTGEGRMAEPSTIVSFIESDVLGKLPLRGKKILVTAGPTYEAIDPVRFIGNHSSGKMGFDIAEKAAIMGAEVTLISGPTHLELSNSQIKLIRVTSAKEMYDACFQYYNVMDVVIAAAAVADYRPKNAALQKIKKTETTLSITLEKTEDILASLGEQKQKQLSCSDTTPHPHCTIFAHHRIHILIL